MIYIRETIPFKMSGLSSFIISFAYNSNIIDAIKTLPIKYYIKTLQAWEIPSDELAVVLDTLTFLDDIQLIMLPPEEKLNLDNLNLTEDEIKEFKFSPFAHQIEGINFGLKHKHWLLLDSMGLG